MKPKMESDEIRYDGVGYCSPEVYDEAINKNVFEVNAIRPRITYKKTK